jgi:hypothetical protein
MSDANTIGRRQFLVYSSTGALATAVLGPKLFADVLNSAPRRLAVGYAAFGENAAVSSASSLTTVDGGFIGRGARISVSGSSGAGQNPRSRRTVELLAHYSYLDGAERKTTPFRAWGCSRVTGCQGSPTSFLFPVDEVQKISFTVSAESGTPSAAAAGPATRREALVPEGTKSTELPVVLSLQGEAGTFKLARGFYVVVPIFEGDSDPRWSAYSMRQVEGRWSLVDGAGAVAPFEHFVLRIDYDL